MSSSRTIEFTKMHGAGNDFVVLDATEREPIADLETAARFLSHRQLGVGADQVLVVRRAQDPDAEFRMDIYDADGSQVEMCGNGIRAVYKWLRDRGLTTRDEIGVETLAGVVRPRWMGEDRVRVDMGRPVLEPAKIPTTVASEGPILDVPLDVDGERVVVSCASMGNPHAVVVVDDPEAAPVGALGPRIENHPAFPNRTNVEFVAIEARDRIRQRTWERGSGETLACGTGACAVTVTQILRGVVDRQVEVVLRGGSLDIVWESDDASVFMTGPAAEVYTGSIPVPGG